METPPNRVLFQDGLIEGLMVKQVIPVSTHMHASGAFVHVPRDLGSVYVRTRDVDDDIQALGYLRWTG